MTLLHVFFLISLFEASKGTECSTLSYATLVPTYNDKVVVVDIELQTYNNITKSACHWECTTAQFCLSFHYGQSDNVCILLRRRLVGFPTSEVFNSEGYVLFQVQKPLSVPGSVCEVNVDCESLANSHCHEGSCRCDIGFDNYGSVCRNLTECTVFGNTFVTYEHRAINGDYLDELWDLSPELCQDSCINRSQCRSADMDVSEESCYIQESTWLDVPESDRTDWTDYDFYQRGCIW